MRKTQCKGNGAEFSTLYMPTKILFYNRAPELKLSAIVITFESQKLST